MNHINSKRINVTLICVLCALMCFVNFLINKNNKKIEAEATAQYGSYQISINNIPFAKAEKIRGDVFITDSAVFLRNISQLNSILQNITVTDENYCSLAGVNILTGSFPKTAQEVLIGSRQAYPTFSKYSDAIGKKIRINKNVFVISGVADMHEQTYPSFQSYDYIFNIDKINENKCSLLIKSRFKNVYFLQKYISLRYGISEENFTENLNLLKYLGFNKFGLTSGDTCNVKFALSFLTMTVFSLALLLLIKRLKINGRTRNIIYLACVTVCGFPLIINYGFLWLFSLIFVAVLSLIYSNSALKWKSRLYLKRAVVCCLFIAISVCSVCSIYLANNWYRKDKFNNIAEYSYRVGYDNRYIQKSEHPMLKELCKSGSAQNFDVVFYYSTAKFPRQTVPKNYIGYLNKINSNNAVLIDNPNADGIEIPVIIMYLPEESYAEFCESDPNKENELQNDECVVVSNMIKKSVGYKLDYSEQKEMRIFTFSTTKGYYTVPLKIRNVIDKMKIYDNTLVDLPIVILNSKNFNKFRDTNQLQKMSFVKLADKKGKENKELFDIAGIDLSDIEQGQKFEKMVMHEQLLQPEILILMFAIMLAVCIGIDDKKNRAVKRRLIAFACLAAVSALAILGATAVICFSFNKTSEFTVYAFPFLEFLAVIAQITGFGFIFERIYRKIR